MNKEEKYELVLDQYSWDDIIDTLSIENFEKVKKLIFSMISEEDLNDFLEG